jgi:hypothetical protein
MQTKDRAMVKPSQNGVKPTANEAKTAEQQNAKMEVTAAAVEAEKQPEEKAAKLVPMTSAADRLKKVEQFQKLGERFDFLKGKDQELKNFTISQDGVLAKITLACPGGTVEISNSLIIEKVVQLCQSELDQLLAKTEAEILTFVI